MRRGLLLGLLALPWIASAQVAVPLDCGTVADGNFSVGLTDFYNFNAIGGDAILVRVLNPGGDKAFTFKVSVTDPVNHTITARPNPTNSTVGATASAEYDLPISGPYQIRVTNTSAGLTGSYKVTFVFINRPCTSNTLTCGGGVRDLFTGPLQARTYQFDAQAGDILSTRIVRFAPFSSGVINGNFVPAVLFYSPSGHAIPAGTSAVTAVIAAPTGTGRLDFTAAESGLYNVLVLDTNNSNGGNFGLVITKLNGTCGSNEGTVSCGTVTQGSLGAAFNIDRLKMSVNTGDIVVLRAAASAAGSAIVPFLEVYDASAAQVPLTAGVIPGNRPVPTFTFTAKSSGDFLILLRDLNTGQNTGPYAITLLRLNRPCAAQSLACGSVVDGKVSGLLGVTQYTLDANAGDNYLLRILRGDQNAVFRPRADVYGPAGNLLQSLATSDLGRLTVSLPVTGTYSIVVSDSFDNSQTGNYTISTLRLNQPCGGGTVSCGVPSTAQIPRSLATSVFSYTAAPGESFSIRLLDNGSGIQPALDIFDPNGNAVGQPITGNVTGIDVVQPAGGAYTLVASDANKHPAPGSFTLDLVRTVNACAASPTPGQTVSGVVSGAAPFVAYTIPASAGDSLSIRSASFTPNFSAQMEFYDPTGARLDSQTYSLTRKAPASGNYTVIVGAASPHTGGGYSFGWQALNNPVAPAALTCGGLTNASLGSGNEFRYYSIPAAAGDVLRLLLTKTSDNFSPQLELFDPSGNRIALGADILQTAPAEGNYLAAVTPASSNGETGSFAVAFQRPNNPCNPGTLTCGQSTLRRATLPGQLDTLTFSGTPGDKADIRFSTRAGNYSPLVEMYDAKGARLATNNTGVLQPTLSAAGPFSLLIRDRASVNTGTYRVSLQDLTNACPVNDSEPPTVSLIQPTGGDVIAGGTSFRIAWQSDDNVGVTAQDIALSTDGGQTFTTKIASAVSGTAQSFVWVVPPDIAPSRTAILRVTATDAAANTQSAVSGPLTIIGAGFTPNSTPTFTYDGLNRITQATLSDGHVVTYTWDAAGNLVSVSVK